MIDDLIEVRSKGDPVQAAAVRVRLLLRGIDPDDYTHATEDDPAIINKLEQMAAEYGLGGTKGAYR